MSERKISEQQIRLATECVLGGGIIGYPTESCFGLGCDPGNHSAIERLLQLKQRSVEQGLILVAADSMQLSDYVQWDQLNASQLEKIESSWPGPVSWLIPAAKDASRLLRGQHSTLAVRVPDFALIRDLCRSLQKPLISTSANRHGSPAYKTASELEMYLGGEIDYIIDQAIQGRAQASQIVDAVSLKVLRD